MFEKRYAVIDFETTGFSPARGDRAIEIAAVLIEDGRVKESYQTLINPARPIPAFIQELTGISNAMVRSAPSSMVVMRKVHDFVGNAKLVAHYASFDRRFWDFESEFAGLTPDREWLCTRNLSRRLYPSAGGYRLATLAELYKLPTGGGHRALTDAVVTAHLFLKIQEDLKTIRETTTNDCEGPRVPLAVLRHFVPAYAGLKDSLVSHTHAPGSNPPTRRIAQSRPIPAARAASQSKLEAGVTRASGSRVPIAVFQYLKPAPPKRRFGLPARRHGNGHPSAQVKVCSQPVAE